MECLECGIITKSRSAINSAHLHECSLIVNIVAGNMSCFTAEYPNQVEYSIKLSVMSKHKDEELPTVSIECCENCETHAWCSRHDESKYVEHFAERKPFRNRSQEEAGSLHSRRRGPQEPGAQPLPQASLQVLRR